MSSILKCKLGDVISFGNGKTRPPSEGAIPIYGGNGILGTSADANYIDETIVIGRVGAYCGATYYEDRPIWVSDNALAAKPKNKNNAKYLFYFLKNVNLNLHAQGSSHPLITQTLLNSIDIEIVKEPNEQKTIASVLSSLDDKIDLLHRQNKTLEAMAETLFRQWFVEESKEDWEEIQITDLYEVRDGTHDSPKQKPIGYPLITSKHIQNEKIDIENAYLISEEDFDKVNERSRVDTGDILFSMIGTIGLIFYERSKEIRYAIKNIGLFKTSQNPEWAIYTYLWLKSPIGKQYIDEHKSGSTQEYVSLGSLRGITFQKPPKKLLTDFNRTTSIWLSKIYNNQNQIRTLETLRDTLLPKLMSGEVRVDYP